MEEAQELSDHIAIMDQGKMIASRHARRELGQDRPAQLTGSPVTINTESARVLDAWKAVKGVKQVSAEDGTLTILADDSNRVPTALVRNSRHRRGAHHLRRHPGTQPGGPSSCI